MATKHATAHPSVLTTHPGHRVSFNVHDEDGQRIRLSTLPNAEVIVHFPGRGDENATINESGDAFTLITPPAPGFHTVSFTVLTEEYDYDAAVEVEVSPAEAPAFTVTSPYMVSLYGDVEADIYDPMGNLRKTVEMAPEGSNHTASYRPDPDWPAGTYRAAIRDERGVQDVVDLYVHRPDFASEATFFSLNNWQRQLIEYIKYEMMGDTDPLAPGALLTLEQYAKHWVAVVEEINNMPPYTSFGPRSVPKFWANVLTKGVLCRVFHTLANRSVTVPRFTGAQQPMQTEDHLQGSWEKRYQMMRDEYKEERAYVKGRHLPSPKVTIDPWKAWTGGSVSGSIGMGLIGRPTWAARFGM